QRFPPRRGAAKGEMIGPSTGRCIDVEKARTAEGTSGRFGGVILRPVTARRAPARPASAFPATGGPASDLLPPARPALAGPASARPALAGSASARGAAALFV